MLQLGIEICFFIDLLLGFVTEYTDDQRNLVQDVWKSGTRYLKNGFAYDFIPLIPCNLIFRFRYSRLLFMIKVFRLENTFNAIKHEVLMSYIKGYFKKKLEKLAKDPVLGNDIEKD